MRVLMFSWEYPPHVVGGLGKHVAELLSPLSRISASDLELHLITPRWGGGEPLETSGQATIHRVAPPKVDGDYYAAARQTNLRLEEHAHDLWQVSGPFDLTHVHDWTVAFVGTALSHSYGIPLLSTIHATEQGRGRGHLHNDLSRAIHHAEGAMVDESWRIIACSNYMRHEIADYFEFPRSRITVIPNGVETTRYDRLAGQDFFDFRTRYALASEQIVFSVGRMVYEKGLQVLVRAAPQILAQCPAAKIVIAGKGPAQDSLRSLAWSLGVGEKVLFPGFVSDHDLDRLFKIADCAVFPSLYEPFGIVALEAMAAQCPVVVTDVGGLGEVVEHDQTGITVYPDNVNSLAWGIVHTLQNPEQAAARAENAYRVVRDEYNWKRIACLTVEVYRQTLSLSR